MIIEQQIFEYYHIFCFLINNIMSINYKKQEEEVLALSYALKILKVWFKDVPEINWIYYVDWIPEPVRTLIKTQMDYRQTQIRICSISDATWLTIPNIRKLLKTKTLSELEAFEKVWEKIIIKNRIKIVKPE